MAIIASILAIIWIGSFTMVIRVLVMSGKRTKIIDALFNYSIKHNSDLSYDVMESFAATMLRLFDWTSKNILKDKDLYLKLCREGLV